MLVAYTAVNRTLTLDTTNAGYGQAGTWEATIATSTDNKLTMDISIDRSSLEIFIGNGTAMTADVYPRYEDSNTIEIVAHGGKASFDRITPRVLMDLIYSSLDRKNINVTCYTILECPSVATPRPYRRSHSKWPLVFMISADSKSSAHKAFTFSISTSILYATSRSHLHRLNLATPPPTLYNPPADTAPAPPSTTHLPSS